MNLVVFDVFVFLYIYFGDGGRSWCLLFFWKFGVFDEFVVFFWVGELLVYSENYIFIVFFRVIAVVFDVSFVYEFENKEV